MTAPGYPRTPASARHGKQTPPETSPTPDLLIRDREMSPETPSVKKARPRNRRILAIRLSHFPRSWKNIDFLRAAQVDWPGMHRRCNALMIRCLRYAFVVAAVAGVLEPTAADACSCVRNKDVELVIADTPRHLHGAGRICRWPSG